MNSLATFRRVPIGWRVFAATTVIWFSLGSLFDFGGLFFGVVTLVMTVIACRPRSGPWILLGALSALWVCTFGVSVADPEWTAMNAWGFAWYTFVTWAVYLMLAGVLGLLLRGLVRGVVRLGRRLPPQWRSMDIYGAVDERT